MNISIRSMVSEDMEQVFEIEKESDHDTWDYETFMYAIHHEESYVLVNNSDNQVIGFLFGIETADEFSISNIAIKQKYKRKGLATFLIKRIIEKKEDVNSVFLEVRKSNLPAVKLYEKLGFKFLYIRKSYYHNPIEDAMVMGILDLKEEKRIVEEK